MVDLPQPDSPTRAKVSPGMMSKLTLLTAWTHFLGLPKKLFPTGKRLLRFLTESRDSVELSPMAYASFRTLA